MAAQLYLVTKTVGGGTLVNGLTHGIINADDGSTAAVNIAEAEATARAAGIDLPDRGYFDTIELLGPPTLGIMTTDQDAIFFVGQTTVRSIA